MCSRSITLQQVSEVFLELQESREAAKTSCKAATRLRRFAALSRLTKNLWDQGTEVQQLASPIISEALVNRVGVRPLHLHQILD